MFAYTIVPSLFLWGLLLRHSVLFITTKSMFIGRGNTLSFMAYYIKDNGALYF